MLAELQAHLDTIDRVKADARTLVAGLSDEQLHRRPAPERWSIIECLAHLNTTIRATLPAFDRSIADARDRGLAAPGPFRYGWFSRWMIRSMEPPPKRRMRTFPIFMPVANPPSAATLADFFVVRDELAARLRQADGLDLKRARVVSPVSRFFRLPLGGYFAFVIAHERRHIWQAQQVRAGLT
jgi:DinB family protein